MPVSNRSSAAAASQPAILLIEQYDALAAAIKSVLNKFAPHHAKQVADCLDNAETLATKRRLDLFVIDYDPSFPGLTAFLQKMRKTHPDSRVLVMGGGVPLEIAREYRSFGALQFIGKPYDVGDLGALVQALLGPARFIETGGTLRSLSLPDIIIVQCVGRRSAIIDVKGSGGDSGAVHIVDGQIVHAEADNQTGLEALQSMFSWSNPHLRETTRRISKLRTIHGPWPAVFLEGWRKARPLEEAPSQPPRPKTGKKIVIIDDTEMLLILAEDALSAADPELQISKAVTGLEGLQQVESIRPDLVLLDYSLPDINGDEVCRRLLENEQTSAIPVLMMSGNVAALNATAPRFNNIVETIEKPFLSDTFVDLVQRTLTKGPRPRKAMPAVSEPVIDPVQPIDKKKEFRNRLPAPPPPIPPLPPPREPSLYQSDSQLGRTITAPIVSMGENEVILGLFVEVLSMQLTPQLRMGTIRARPASPTVSLHFPSAAVRNTIPTEIGFQLGATELDENGRLATLRLIPTTKPFQATQMRTAFEIGGVALVPGETRTRLQLTPSGTTPMTMELCARLELGSVALSSNFQIAHLILKWRTSAVRVTLDPKAPEQSGANFQVAVKLDNLGRIAELVLNPVKQFGGEIIPSRAL